MVEQILCARALLLPLLGTLDGKVSELDNRFSSKRNLEQKARRPWDVHLPSDSTVKV